MSQPNRIFELLRESGGQDSLADQAEVVKLAGMIEQIERNIGRSLQFYANESRLTLLEAQALAAVLQLDEHARLSAIAEYVRMPLSTMTGVAARLEKSGLVERKRATDDGRASILSLTEEGTARILSMFRPFFAEVSKVIEQAGSGTMQSVIDSFTIVNEMAEQLVARVDSKKQG